MCWKIETFWEKKNFFYTNKLSKFQNLYLFLNLKVLEIVKKSKFNDDIKKQNMSESMQKSQDGQESPSAYASAESSPTQSMVSSFSTQSFGANETATNRVNVSPMSVSQSMHTISQTTTPTKTTPSKLIPSSMSVSGIDALAKLEELNNQDFTSLPPDLNTQTIKMVIEKAVKSQLEETKPVSPEKPKASMLSIFGRIFTKAAKPATDEKEKQTLSPSKSNLSANSSSSSSSASSSSPNPECSPFKLLAHETKTQLSPESTTTARTSSSAADSIDLAKEAQIFAGSSNRTTAIEKLVQLNELDHEEADPILSASMKSVEDKSSNSMRQNETSSLSSSKSSDSSSSIGTTSSVQSSTSSDSGSSSNENMKVRFYLAFF